MSSTPPALHSNDMAVVPSAPEQMEAAFREMPVEEQMSLLLRSLITTTQRTTAPENDAGVLKGRVTTFIIAPVVDRNKILFCTK